MSRTDLSQTQDTAQESVRWEVFKDFLHPLAISNSECSSDVSAVRLLYILFILITVIESLSTGHSR